MSNELVKPQTGLPGAPIHQQAEKIVNIERVDTMKTQNTFIFSSGLPGMPNSTAAPFSFSRDYYNLIVYGQEPLLQDGHITFEKKRCLVEDDNIDADLKARFSSLSDTAIDELKTFPCLLASENHNYGWTDGNHYAAFAKLADIKNRSNGIELYYHYLFPIQQERLNELSFKLGICGRYHKFNELNHSHWTVKAINLLEVLSDEGLTPFCR